MVAPPAWRRPISSREDTFHLLGREKGGYLSLTPFADRGNRKGKIDSCFFAEVEEAKERSQGYGQKPRVLARPIADAVEQEVLDCLCVQCLRGSAALRVEEITNEGRVDPNGVCRQPALLAQVVDVAEFEVACTRGIQRRDRRPGFGTVVFEERPKSGHFELHPGLPLERMFTP